MKKHYKHLAVAMSMVLFVTGATFPSAPRAEAAAKKAKLSAKKLTVQVGKTKTLKLKNNKKKTKWTIVSGKGKIQLKSKKKNSVKIVGKKTGTAKVQVKAGKKKYTCKITITAGSLANNGSGNSQDTVNTPSKTTQPNLPSATQKPIVSQEEEQELEKNIEVNAVILNNNSGVLLEVTNNNTQLVHCVKIRYHAYSAGVSVGDSSGEVYEVPAGGTKYAYSYLFDASDTVIDEVYIERDFGDIAVDQNFAYTDVSGYLSYDQSNVEEDKEFGKIVLQVSNSYTSSIDKVQILCIFRDGNGAIVDVAQGYIPGGISAKDKQEVEVYRTRSANNAYIDYDNVEIVFNAYKG